MIAIDKEHSEAVVAAACGLVGYVECNVHIIQLKEQNAPQRLAEVSAEVSYKESLNLIPNPNPNPNLRPNPIGCLALILA